MTESEFKQLMIDTVSVENYAQKNELIELLRITTVTFEKTRQFTGKNVWNQRDENIYLSILPEQMHQLEQHKDYLLKLCNKIYPVNDKYALSRVIIKPGLLESMEEETSQMVLFEKIHQQIVAQIQSAKYLIWVAMAWFTDQSLYVELYKKYKQGLCIEIIVDDNEKNREMEFLSETDIPVHWVDIESLYKNIMHDKFCIIDLQTVVHGTFNWTRAANYNKETISVDINRKTAESFATEFIKLKKLSSE